MALEVEELRREQAGYEQQIQAVDEAMKAIQEQIDSMACTVSQSKVLVSSFLKVLHFSVAVCLKHRSAVEHHFLVLSFGM